MEEFIPKVKLPPKLVDVFIGEARYRGAYGGRGSGKTSSFAKMTAVRAMQAAQAGLNGVILCGREYQNSLEDSSMAEVKNAIKSEPWLLQFFDIGEKYIRTKCGRVSYVFSGLRHNIDSIKSKCKILICWVDEAEPVTEYCWQKIVPTVREHGSEIWVSWNPERNNSATDKRFRKNPPSNSKIVELNWRDNPWFMQTELNNERLDDKKSRPDSYEHIWEGAYVEVKEGAYFTKQIIKAKKENRWGILLNEDPLLTVKLYTDIGGTGSKSDNFVFWASQFINQNINIINHYETQGQSLDFHANWLRSEGYTPERAQIILPHDGKQHDRVNPTTYEKAFIDLGYNVRVIPNQGQGAAMQRVESLRNNFHRMYFSSRCDAGMEAVRFYHPKIDTKRAIDLGPEHDWASHSADALGLMSCDWALPVNTSSKNAEKVKKRKKMHVF